MQAILMSIQPKWVEKILNGKKTIEIRKSMPKCKLPIDVYIYCGKGKSYLAFEKMEFGKDRLALDNKFNKLGKSYYINDKVVAKFTYKEDYVINHYNCENEIIQKGSCLTANEIKKYLGKKSHGGGIIITDLVIFDKPKELGEFKVKNKELKSFGAFGWALDNQDSFKPLEKAPQSFCYVEVGE
jgi:predicted transcriptional regulator